MKRHDHIALRAFDPQRGSFDPVSKEPQVNREKNPRGTRHIDKTRQDYMPRDKRPRVIAWHKRKDAM